MNQYSQGEGSAGLSVQPLKRRRGRPRKDPNLKQTQAARVPPPGFEGVKEPPQRVNIPDGVDSMVGQAVTGVVEANFDAGYLLAVRIGNSTTILRGVVFKPGHYAPVTAENDIAPHLPMIRRNDVPVPVPAGNQGSSRRQKLAVVPSKRKYGSPQMAPSVPPVGVRGTVVPVVLQPLNFPNGVSSSNQVPSESSPAAHMMAFGDKDVHMVEPLSMLPPDRSVPVSQIFLSSQPHSSNQVLQGTKQNESEPSFIQEGKSNPMTPTEFDNPFSSDTSETQTDSGKEASKSSAEDSGIVSKPETATISSESVHSASMVKPFFNYGTGRMTELLHAVQENMKDQVQIPPPGLKVEVGQTAMTEAAEPKKEANAP